MNIACAVSAGWLLAFSAGVASGQTIVNRNGRIADVFDTPAPKTPANPQAITFDPPPVNVLPPSTPSVATPTYPARSVPPSATTVTSAPFRIVARSAMATPPPAPAYPVGSAAPLVAAPVVTSTPLRSVVPSPAASVDAGVPRLSLPTPTPAPTPTYTVPMSPTPRLSSGLGAPASAPVASTASVPAVTRYSAAAPFSPAPPRDVATALVPAPRSATGTSFNTGISGASKSYVFSANDVVELKVFQEPDLDSKVRINKDGNVTLPLIGTMRLAGRTVDEATAMIRETLDRRFLVNPQVSLTVVDYAKRRFTVLGEVQKPGSFEIPNEENVNLLQALALAGGYTRIGEPTRITVVRVENGKRVILKLNAKAMARDQKSAPFEIKPDDTITVGESVF